MNHALVEVAKSTRNAVASLKHHSHGSHLLYAHVLPSSETIDSAVHMTLCGQCKYHTQYDKQCNALNISQLLLWSIDLRAAHLLHANHSLKRIHATHTDIVQVKRCHIAQLMDKCLYAVMSGLCALCQYASYMSQNQ